MMGEEKNRKELPSPTALAGSFREIPSPKHWLDKLEVGTLQGKKRLEDSAPLQSAKACRTQGAEGAELIRKWTVYIVVCGFLAGLGLCLTADLNGSHHGSSAPSTVTLTAQTCGTSVVPCEGQSDPHRLLLASSLGTEEDAFHKGVTLTPPFPPPRG